MKYWATPFIIFSRKRVCPAVALALMTVLTGCADGFGNSELTYEEVRAEILGERARFEEILAALPTEGGFEWQLVGNSYQLLLDDRPIGYVILASSTSDDGAEQWFFSFSAWDERVISRLRYPDPVAAAEVLHSFAVKAAADPIPAFTKN
ncbi:MAG: hypothetical protein ISN29_02210 [Gammaproteobacteria bacterium AqS3]|nr:hypothetical protein [Gammaproteobacteria bacterium AqS3]